MIEYAHLNNDNEDYVYDGSNIHFAGKKQGWKQEDWQTVEALPVVSYTIIGWHQSWLVATRRIAKIPVGDVYVDISVCVGAAWLLVLRLNISSK